MIFENELYGLILMGGQSTRMGQDKAAIDYHGKPHAEYVFELLRAAVPNTFVSVRKDQKCDFTDQVIEDSFDSKGPINGILSAMQKHPNKAWLVLACDLPMISANTIKQLVQERDASKNASAFIGHMDLPEPLMAIWEPTSHNLLIQHHIEEGKSCPRKFLINSDIKLIKSADERAVYNANSPEEYQQAKQWIS